MPEDTGTSQLINQLTNPPNPMAQFGQTINTANALKQFQADKAISDIYGQSIDPQTGQVDLGKFNALASQNPAALWKFGAQMQQAGQGTGAEGLGTQAQTDAARGQLTLLNGYLTPYLEAANNGQPVSQDDVRTTLNNAIGLTPQMKAAALAKLGTLQPGQDVGPMLKGWQFATQSAESQASRLYPTTGQNAALFELLSKQTSWPDPNDPTKTNTGPESERLRQLYGLDPLKLLGPVGGGGYGPAGGFKGTPGGSSGGKGGAPGSSQSSVAPAGAFDTGDPDLNLIAKYESNYKPMAGWGGAQDVDLSGYPLTSTGFPDWKGNPGPQGNSTAAGLFQIEKSTWNSVAPQLIAEGKMQPDFSIASQIAVAKALKEKNGLSDWLPYNPQLAAAHARGEVVQFPQGGGQQGTAGVPQRPVQVASLPPTTATDVTANPYAGTGGQGTYVPPGGTASRNIATGQPAPPGGVVPQPPGPGQPTNINQPTPPVAGPRGPMGPVGAALRAGGSAQLPVQPIDFPRGATVAIPNTLPETTKASGQQYIADLAQYNQLPQRLSPLTQAAGILKANPNLGTGTGAEDIQKLASLAQNFGFTLSPQATTNLTAFTELNKDLERYYLGLPGGQRSDLAQAETKMSQPSTAMQREALQDLVARTIGLERANSAPLVNFQQQHGQANAQNYAPQYQAEAAAYRNTLDPVAFGFDYMTTQERNAYLNSLDQAGKDKYKASIKEASRLFGIPIPR